MSYLRSENPNDVAPNIGEAYEGDGKADCASQYDPDDHKNQRHDSFLNGEAENQSVREKEYNGNDSSESGRRSTHSIIPMRGFAVSSTIYRSPIILFSGLSRNKILPEIGELIATLPVVIFLT
jgi:hypothetical protein